MQGWPQRNAVQKLNLNEKDLIAISIKTFHLQIPSSFETINLQELAYQLLNYHMLKLWNCMISALNLTLWLTTPYRLHPCLGSSYPSGWGLSTHASQTALQTCLLKPPPGSYCFLSGPIWQDGRLSTPRSEVAHVSRMVASPQQIGLQTGSC